jgi:hypothetical protein
MDSLIQLAALIGGWVVVPFLVTLPVMLITLLMVSMGPEGVLLRQRLWHAVFGISTIAYIVWAVALFFGLI